MPFNIANYLEIVRQTWNIIMDCFNSNGKLKYLQEGFIILMNKAQNLFFRKNSYRNHLQVIK